MKLHELNDGGFNLYLDMDGVLVDLISGVQKVLKDNYDIDNASLTDKIHKKAFWGWFNRISKSDPNAAIEFWASLPWMSDGKELWNFCKNHNPTILSSPGTSNVGLITRGKKAWVSRNIGNIPAIYKDDKESEVKGPKCILVDDRTKQTIPWDNKGGTSVLHTSASDTIKKLTDIFDSAVDF